MLFMKSPALSSPLVSTNQIRHDVYHMLLYHIYMSILFQCRESVLTFTSRLIQRLTQMLNVARQLGDNTEAVCILHTLYCHPHNVLCHQLILALEGIRAVMEIHLRAIVSKKQPHCWFNTWDLSQIVHSFETILAMVFNKRSTIDMMSLEKVQLHVHNTQ